MNDTPTLPPPNHHADHPHFAGVSGLMAATTMLFGRQPTARLAADLIDLGAGDRLVDVGCGPGSGARLAARRGATVTAVDPADVMLRIAKSVPRRGRVTWARGTAEALPVPGASATVVWSLAAVHHWSDIALGLTEAHRVLEPGGHLLAVERQIRAGSTGLANHGWSPPQAESFAAACRAAGFQSVSVSTHEAEQTTVLAVLARRP